MNEQRTYRGFGQSETNSGAGLGISLLLIGLGIGAITALLLAPDSGRKTRKRLRRGYEDAREKFGDWSDQANDVWERGSDWADQKRKIMNKRVKPIRKGIFG